MRAAYSDMQPKFGGASNTVLRSRFSPAVRRKNFARQGGGVLE